MEKSGVEKFLLVLGLKSSLFFVTTFAVQAQMIPINIFFQLNVLVVLMVNVSNLMSASKISKIAKKYVQ